MIIIIILYFQLMTLRTIRININETVEINLGQKLITEIIILIIILIWLILTLKLLLIKKKVMTYKNLW